MVENGESENQGLDVVEAEAVDDFEKRLGVSPAERSEINRVGDAEQGEGDFIADLAPQGLDLVTGGVGVVEGPENLRLEEPVVDRAGEGLLNLVDQRDGLVGYHGAFLSRRHSSRGGRDPSLSQYIGMFSTKLDRRPHPLDRAGPAGPMPRPLREQAAHGSTVREQQLFRIVRSGFKRI